MKISLLALVMAGSISFAVAGNTNPHPEKCGVIENTKRKMQENPNLERLMQNDEQRLQQLIEQNQNSRISNTIYTIPVVVHIVWKTGSQNITDAQILSQIAVLNEDFGHMNADTASIPVS